MSAPREPRLARQRLSHAEQSAMMQALLARTTGSPCQRARVLLAGAPEREAADADAALLAAHLEHCQDCRTWDAALAEIRGALASLAEVTPDAAFVSAVTARTSARHKWTNRRQPAGRLAPWEWWTGVHAWLGQVGQRLLARPRLSLELAYLATVLVVILVGNPAVIAERMSTVGVTDARAGQPQAGTAAVPGTTPGLTWSDPNAGAAVTRQGQPAPPENVIARGWEWLSEKTSGALDAAWNWMAWIVEWLSREFSAQPSGEPSSAPVRDK